MYLHTLYRYILSALRMSITANFNIDFMELDFRGGIERKLYEKARRYTYM